MTQLLLDVYGWKGTLWILGALACHCIICGSFVWYFEKQRTRFCYLTKELHCGLQEDEQNTESKFTILKKFRSITRGTLNVEVLKNSSFHNVLVLAAASGWSFSSWIIYIIPHAEEKQLTPSTAVLLGTIGGIGNILGKLLYPVLKMFISNKSILYLTCVVCAVSLALDPLLNSFIGLAVSSSIYALSVGMLFTAGIAIMYEVIDNDDMIDAFSWFYFAYGTASMTGCFTSGKIDEDPLFFIFVLSNFKFHLTLIMDVTRLYIRQAF